MKIQIPSFPQFLFSLVFPSLVILFADRAIGETAQYIDREGPTHTDSNALSETSSFNQSLSMVEKLVGRLGSGKLHHADDAQRVANKGLETILPGLLRGDDKHAQELGFEVNKVTKLYAEREYAEQTPELLPNVFPIYEVGLNALRGFVPRTKVKTLLTYTNQLLLPIAVNNQVRSSVTVRFIPDALNGVGQYQKKAEWRPTRWGRQKLIRQLTKEHDRLKTQKPGFLVSIPSLNRNFLGYEDDSVIKLIPLTNDYFFKAGKSYLAHDVFKLLSAEAEGVDGSPR